MTHATAPGTGDYGATRGAGRTGRAEQELDKARALRWAALAFGVVFLLVGIAGFIPGLTSDVDAMEAAGHESESELLGIFQVSVLHNVLHILLGLAGIAAYRRWQWARTYLIVGGIAYAGLFVYGLLVDHDSDANFVPVNDADNWLHLALAVAMLALGIALAPKGRDDRHSLGNTTTTNAGTRGGGTRRV